MYHLFLIKTGPAPIRSDRYLENLPSPVLVGGIPGQVVHVPQRFDGLRPEEVVSVVVFDEEVLLSIFLSKKKGSFSGRRNDTEVLPKEMEWRRRMLKRRETGGDIYRCEGTHRRYLDQVWPLLFKVNSPFQPRRVRMKISLDSNTFSLFLKLIPKVGV